MIITISRETGSGGHTVGKMLAERLGYAFYDKEIIQEVAREMHLDKKTVLENGETMSDQTYMDMVSGYILAGRKDAFHVFIHADMVYRIARVQRHDGITGEERRICRELEVKDHSRGMFYQYFSGREWGKGGNYNLMIDTGVFTKTQSVELILDALEKYQGGRNNA